MVYFSIIIVVYFSIIIYTYSEDIVKMVMEHTDKFYIRAERYAGLYEKVKRQRKRSVIFLSDLRQ